MPDWLPFARLLWWINICQLDRVGCLRLLIAAGANLELQNKVRDYKCGVLSMVWERLLDCAQSKIGGAGGGEGV